MEDLSDLLAGVQIKKQHPYFNMAKTDIYKLANQFANYKHYERFELSLLQNITIFEPDLYQLNIVIQYIITYGNQLFLSYLQNMKVDSYNKNDYEQYLNEYVDELTSFIK